MSTCIRRAHTYWTTCPCPPCRVDARRKAKLHRNGMIHRVPADEAWAVIDRLRANGWSTQAIATAAGIPWRSVDRAVYEDTHADRTTRPQFGPHHAAAIVGYGEPTAGTLGAHGARRRMRGLARQGWDLRRISEMTGVRESTLAAIRGGVTERVGILTHQAIRGAAERIGMTIGPSRQAIAHAIRKDWAGLLAWDDVDDINAKPSGNAIVGRRADALRDLADMRAGAAEACRRLDANEEALAKWCARHGLADVWRQLVAQDRREVA